MLRRLIFWAQLKPCWLVQSQWSCLDSDLLHSRDSPARFWTYRLSCSDSHDRRPFPEFSVRRKLVSAQAAGVLSGIRNETASTDRSSEDHAGVLVALVGLEAGIGHRSATDPDSVAPPRVPAVLALEVETGKAALPRNIRELIAEMARENLTWGQGRVASELSLKLGIYVSPRTVRAYWPSDRGRRCRRTSSQSWQTFIRNHAQSIVACDFLVAVTVRFRVLYVLIVMEVGSRKILHCNVTAQPTAAWTLQAVS